jgi:PhnB protein
MNTTLNPYLRFNDGKCREAMEFYKDIFGGTVEYMTIGESPMAGDMPKEKQGLIMHAVLVSGGIKFMGADMMRNKAVIGDNVSVAVSNSSEQELNQQFDKLAQGGDIFMKPEMMPWGGVYGMVTDKYGVEWQLNFQKEPMK